MATKNKLTPHLQKASDILMAIKPNISADDRKEACDNFHLSDATVGSYLNGRVRDVGTAEKLIVFFLYRGCQFVDLSHHLINLIGCKLGK